MGQAIRASAKGYPGHRREQLPVALQGEIEGGGAASSPVQLRNISSLGFIAETGERLRPESHIFIRLPGTAPCEAVVHWSAGGCIGARFVERLDLQPLKAAAPDAF